MVDGLKTESAIVRMDLKGIIAVGIMHGESATKKAAGLSKKHVNALNPLNNNSQSTPIRAVFIGWNNVYGIIKVLSLFLNVSELMLLFLIRFISQKSSFQSCPPSISLFVERLGKRTPSAFNRRVKSPSHCCLRFSLFLSSDCLSSIVFLPTNPSAYSTRETRIASILHRNLTAYFIRSSYQTASQKCNS
jgi:hypothetical protein